MTSILVADVHDVLPLLRSDGPLLVEARAPGIAMARQSLIVVEASQDPANVTTTVVATANGTNASNATNGTADCGGSGQSFCSKGHFMDMFFSGSSSDTTLQILGPTATAFVLFLIATIGIFCCLMRNQKAHQETTLEEQPSHDEMHEVWVRPQTGDTAARTR